jgi:F-type H+-transporting ATPase subunit a
MCRFVSMFGSVFAAAEHGGAENPGDVVLHHLTDHAVDNSVIGWINSNFFSQKFLGFIDMKITWWVILLWATVFLALLIFIPLSRSIVKSVNGSSSRWVNFWEVIIEYISNEVVQPNFGAKTKRVAPFFLTIFFFILLCNFIGLIPGLNTPTGNLAVTCALAALILLIMFFMGFVKHGPLWLITGIVPHGIPLPIIPLMWAIELVSLFMKPFVLMIRLFANMLAGHIMIIVFLMLMYLFQNLFIAFGSVPFVVFVYGLEIVVCLVQAYVFAMLSAIFIAGCMEESH